MVRPRPIRLRNARTPGFPARFAGRGMRTLGANSVSQKHHPLTSRHIISVSCDLRTLILLRRHLSQARFTLRCYPSIS